jgi:putative thioredoxin
LPTAEEDEVAALLAKGDEASLRQAFELAPDDTGVVVALATVLVADGQTDEALALLARVPETPETRHLAALARTGEVDGDDLEAKLDGLLDRVKDDETAREEFVDLLDVLGPDDPRTATYRKALTARLY